MHYRQLSIAAALVLGSVAAAQAAQVGVSVTATAIDTPLGFDNVKDPESAQGTSPPVATATSGAMAGSSSSSGEADADGLTGAMHMSLFAATSDPHAAPETGRDASVEGNMDMTGSITLHGSGTGTATFAAVLEGLYNGGPADLGIGNSISGYYSYLAGSTSLGGAIGFIGGDAGSLYIPMVVTEQVYDGEVVNFDLELLNMFIETIGGTVAFDASNTFKISSIDLPAGYTFTSDSDGFLSTFGAATPPTTTPVPEPATWALSLAGLAAVVGAVSRRRRSSRCSIRA